MRSMWGRRLRRSTISAPDGLVETDNDADGRSDRFDVGIAIPTLEVGVRNVNQLERSDQTKAPIDPNDHSRAEGE